MRATGPSGPSRRATDSPSGASGAAMRELSARGRTGERTATGVGRVRAAEGVRDGGDVAGARSANRTGGRPERGCPVLVPGECGRLSYEATVREAQAPPCRFAAPSSPRSPSSPSCPSPGAAPRATAPHGGRSRSSTTTPDLARPSGNFAVNRGDWLVGKQTGVWMVLRDARRGARRPSASAT